MGPGVLNDALALADELVDVSKTAKRNRKSLSGDNFYGNKFHEHVVALKSEIVSAKPRIKTAGVPQAAFDRLETLVSQISSPVISPSDKGEANRELKLLAATEIDCLLAQGAEDFTPKSEQVLPHDVVHGTRTYLEKVIAQANGCYEHQWFDACSVMIRRFIETLIVEVYEAREIADSIKDANGDILLLSKLIDTALDDSRWMLGREVKRTLPLVKRLGDRAAHNRRYVATKRDVDSVVPGLRVVADELLHLAGMK